ncbi:uncharacterized protein LOC119686999 [Teleopsis dalmanni]|uniref:uncharacterized protein LOC119686999 n=1 Tax=Teleopsis dalmanni TaxID=139649 RepID=UPI0018CCFD07|nr:uncharacterized protein LOC119686999 [Teleopsis dalmanni]
MTITVTSDKSENYIGKRRERALPIVFPPTAPTRVQWIIGIGIPLEELVFEAMTTGYVLKAEYFLPSNASQLRTKTHLNIAGRRRRNAPDFEQFLINDEEFSAANKNREEFLHKKVLTSYRWSVYKAFEGLAVRLGLVGRDCVLKSICEAAEIPFHYKNGLFGELLYILLTPSTSVDKLSEYADNQYYQAEHLGRSGVKCELVFRKCKKSLLNHFTDIYSLEKGFLRLVS